MEINHFSHDHPLIFTEELENDGNKKVVCSAGCEEPVSGSVYKCPRSKCDFLLHKSCAELSPQAQHPLHPNHPLTLMPASTSNICDACCKRCGPCFFYSCKLCDFDLDIKCISRWRTDPDECHQHAFIPILKKINFPCEVCGGRDNKCTGAYLCSICLLLAHRDCTRHSPSLKITRHSHLLTLTNSLQRVQGHSRIFCKLCYKKVGENTAVYYCKECNYAVDLECAKACEDRASSANSESVPSKSELIEEINPAEDETAQPQEIKHFSHEHTLVFSDQEVKDGKFCDGCSLLISAPFYHCEQCNNFFLHKRCAKLPTVKKHLLHPHPLTLLSQSPYPGGLFRCRACKGFRNGFTYRCEECYYNLDLQCSSVPGTLEHKGHKHSLFLALNSSQVCNACKGSRPSHRGLLFVCTECEFAVCIKCSILPYEARHRYDNHLLTLTYSAEDDSGEYYCLICEEERDESLWFYYCAECDFAAHPDCVLDQTAYIKFGRIHKFEDHRHPLTVVQKTKYSPPCDSCGLPFSFDGMAIECSQCKVSIHHYHSSYFS